MQITLTPNDTPRALDIDPPVTLLDALRDHLAAGAAVLNAIHHACGVRVRDLPATPDKVPAGLS